VRKMVGMNLTMYLTNMYGNVKISSLVQLIYANKNFQRKKKSNHHNSQKSTNEHMVRWIGSNFVQIICAFKWITSTKLLTGSK
jgi:hypothetical protein